MTEDLFADDAEEAQARVLAEVAKARAEEARLRKHEADFTPRPPCRAVLEAALVGSVLERGQGRCLQGPPTSVWPAIGRAGGSLGSCTDHHSSAPWVELDGERRVFRVLDICAGAGVWSSVVRQLAAIIGIEVWITAVEIREEERENLGRHADEVITGNWQEALGMVLGEDGVWTFGPDGPREYDLIVGNPAFSHARAQVRPEWEQESWDVATAIIKEAKRRAKEGLEGLDPADVSAARKELSRIRAKRKRLVKAVVADGHHPALAEHDPEASMPVLCLRSAPAVVLYLTQQCWTKTASGWLVRQICPPAVAWDIPSSVGHRGPGVGMDSIPYTGFVWTRGHEGATQTFLLEPIEERTWKVRPGTESDEWLREHGIPFLE